MKSIQKALFLLVIASLVFLQACQKALVIKNVNYAQNIESVLEPDDEGTVSDVRHGIRFSVLSLQATEFEQDSTKVIRQIRLIRNNQGYYFITANNFKHVYVMKPAKGELKLENKILVNESGISNPALNWRSPLVELVGLGSTEQLFLTENGIIKPQEEE